MKARWIIIAATALMIITAGRALTTEPSANRSPINVALRNEALGTEALPDEALARKSGCFECHSVDKAVEGPAFNDVAMRYKDDPRARDVLIEKVKKGGKGNWSEIAHGALMPPFSPRLSDSDITRLVDWVLSLQGSQ